MRTRKYRQMQARRYGLTLDQVESMWSEQRGLCKACGEEMLRGGNGARAMAVDHDHTTGAVRGLLHQRCNMAIGQALDDPELLRKLAAYLDGCL